MKNVKVLLLFGLLVLLGCSKDAFQEEVVQPSENVTTSQRGEFVPFKGNGTLSSVSRSDNGNIRTILFAGEGRATHLGRYIASFIQIVDLTNPSTFTGSAVLTAANGDELTFEYEGSITVDPPTAAFTGEIDFTFSGGTGRFEDAQGGGVAQSSGVFLHFPPLPDDVLTFDISYDGEISY